MVASGISDSHLAAQPSSSSHTPSLPTSGIASVLCQQIQQRASPIPSKSIFSPEETGVTYGCIGKSFSGKTTFIVNQLNKLTEQELAQYNAIIFFNESAHAQPLKDLAPHVKTKMILLDRFCPKVLQVLKKINDATKLLFKFLVIFDHNNSVAKQPKNRFSSSPTHTHTRFA